MRLYINYNWYYTVTINNPNTNDQVYAEYYIYDFICNRLINYRHVQRCHGHVILGYWEILFIDIMNIYRRGTISCRAITVLPNKCVIDPNINTAATNTIVSQWMALWISAVTWITTSMDKYFVFSDSLFINNWFTIGWLPIHWFNIHQSLFTNSRFTNSLFINFLFTNSLFINSLVINSLFNGSLFTIHYPSTLLIKCSPTHYSPIHDSPILCSKTFCSPILFSSIH